MYNAYAQCNYQTSKTKRIKINPTKLTKEKSATKRGNKPQAPSQANKGVMLKRLGEDICGLPLRWYMNQVCVAILMIISQEVEPDINVFDSGV